MAEAGLRSISGGKAPGAAPRQSAAKGNDWAKNPQVVAAAVGELEQLFVKAKDAAGALGDAIKRVARESGYEPANVRAFVSARVGDTVDKKRRNAEQQMELFEEVE